MFKIVMAKVADLEKRVWMEEKERELKQKEDTLKKEIWVLEKEREQLQKDFDLKVENRLNALKTSMQKELIESDILRTQAIAKLEVLEKIDTRSDANEIKKLLHEMVSSMANNNKQMPITINKIV